MNTLRLGYGPLLLLLYQAAPVNVRQDSLGRYRISVGYGTGQWQNERFSCDGQLLSATPVRHHSAGIQVEAWPDNHVRITGFAGVTRSTVGATVATDPEYSSPYIEQYDGTFGGALLAYEGEKFGIGIGKTRIPGASSLGTAHYLRVGRLDAAHFRLDVTAPDPALPSVGWGRVGVASYEGHLRHAGGFLGIGLGPFEYSSKAAFVGELHFPIASHFTARLHGLVGPAENSMQWNLGTGLQYDFGR